MVVFAVSQAARSTLQSLPSLQSSDLSNDDAKDRFDHHTLINAARTARRASDFDDTKHSLHALLRGAQLHHDRVKVFERSPELEATLARIRRKQEESEYASMIGDHSAGPLAMNLSEGLVWQQTSSHLSAMANIALSAVAVVAALWWWSSSVYMAAEAKVSLCGFGAIVIVVAESFLYARYFESVEKAKSAPKPLVHDSGVR